MNIWVEDYKEAPTYDMNCDVCGKRIWMDWPWPFGKRIKILYRQSNTGGISVSYTHGGKCEKMGIFMLMDMGV